MVVATKSVRSRRKSHRAFCALTLSERSYYFSLGLDQTCLNWSLERSLNRENARATRSVSGCAGDDDSPNVKATAAAWVCPGAAHQANIERFAPDRRRVA